MKNNFVITIILVVVFAAVGFYGGTMYQKNQTASNFSNFGGGAGGRGGAAGGFAGRRAGGGGQVVGTILTQDSSSISVKLADGSSKIVLLNDKTIYNKATSASVSDLKVGDRVAVFGMTNSDGSVNAADVQLNPIVRTGNERPSGMPVPTQ